MNTLIANLYAGVFSDTVPQNDDGAKLTLCVSTIAGADNERKRSHDETDTTSTYTSSITGSSLDMETDTKLIAKAIAQKLGDPPAYQDTIDDAKGERDPPSYTCTVYKIGDVLLKCELERGGKRAPKRSWK